MNGTHIAVAIMCLVWGSTWFVLREGLEEMQPFGSAALRFAVAYVLMVPLAGRLARREGGKPPTLDLVAAMATGNLALGFGIVYWAEQTVPSGLAAVLWGVFPIMTALVGHLMLPASRIAGRQWIGLAIGFLGVALLFVTDVSALGGDASLRALVLLLSPLASAISTAYIKRHGADVSSALLNRAGLLGGALLLSMVALVFEGGISLPQSVGGALSIGYLAAMGTVLTFTLYFWVLRSSSALSLSLIAYVTPVIALAIGASLGEERVTPWTIVGLVLVLAGCAGVLRGPGREAGDDPGALRPTIPS